MNNSSSNSRSPRFNLLCATIGHNYIVTRNVTNHIHEYKCTQCECEVTDSEGGHLEALTKHIKDVNNCVAEFFQKRTNRETVHQ